MNKKNIIGSETLLNINLKLVYKKLIQLEIRE